MTGYTEFTSGVLEAFLATDYEEYTVLDNQYPSEDVGYGMGINFYEDVAGWERYPEVGVTVPRHAFVDWPDEGDRTRTDIHPNFDGFSESYRINDAGHAVGYTLPYGETEIPTLWWDEGNGTWTAVEVEDLSTGAIFGSLTDINNENEVVGWFGGTSIESSAFYVQLSSDPTSGGSVTVDLNDDGTGMPLILYPRAMRGVGAFDLATCINDNGWIGGSCKPDAEENDTHPMLLIPQDVNNNGVPDIREILTNRINNATELDSNGNWLLDWAENDSTNNDQFMRVGLHSPGVKGGMSRDIQNVQIVRFPTKYENVEDVQQVGPTLENEFYGILDVVNGVESQEQTCLCEDYLNQLELWARRGENHTPGQALQNEIIITLRNQSATNKKRDVIPDENHGELLEALRKYSYRFAHAIDYMQFGNESFSGTGMFKIDGQDFSDYSGQGLVNVTEEVHVWILEQLEVARSASALAGRPLRFIGPGNPGSTVEAGYTGTPVYDPEEPEEYLSNYEDKCAYVIGATNTLLNEERMYFDLHAHYETALWAAGNAQTLGVIDMVVDTNGTGWTSNVPEATVCLEWGPRADTTHDWWTGEGQDPLDVDNAAEFAKYLDSGTPPDPLRIWELFIERENELQLLGWKDGQFEGDFEMPRILADLESNGFAAACYGPVGQDLDTANRYNIAALRALLVDAGHNPPAEDYIGNTDRWTPLRTLYQTAAGEYLMGNGVFIPHQTAFDEDESCPDCQ